MVRAAHKMYMKFMHLAASIEIKIASVLCLHWNFCFIFQFRNNVDDRNKGGKKTKAKQNVNCYSIRTCFRSDTIKCVFISVCVKNKPPDGMSIGVGTFVNGVIQSKQSDRWFSRFALFFFLNGERKNVEFNESAKNLQIYLLPFRSIMRI